MDGANLRLSEAEMALISSSEWILTKNAILVKVNALLAQLQVMQSEWLATAAGAVSAGLPDGVLSNSPKISRGENYQGLPYLVLDHPRIFERQDIFAIRTFFWWGNFFSTTLHLAGVYKNQLQERILSRIASNHPDQSSERDHPRDRELYIGVHTDPWQYHLESGNYRLVTSLDPPDLQELVTGHPFIKLSYVRELGNWEQLPALLFEDFRKLVEIVTN